MFLDPSHMSQRDGLGWPFPGRTDIDLLIDDCGFFGARPEYQSADLMAVLNVPVEHCLLGS